MSVKTWTGAAVAVGLALVWMLASGPLKPATDRSPDPGQPTCLDCHRQPNINTNEGVAASQEFCLGCHEKPDTVRTHADGSVSLQLARQALDATPHRYAACIHCHTDVARSPHRTETGARCTGCHPVHGEKTARAPHLRVDCQACHFTHGQVRLDPGTHSVRLAHVDAEGRTVGLLDHNLANAEDIQTCRRCHHDDNAVGAPAAVLPAKGLLCVVCHPSPAAVGHPIFWAALVVFILGVLLMVRFWFLGSVQGEETTLHRKISLSSDAVWRTVFSRRIWTLLNILFWDILLQRRILQGSVQRWSMHTLIYLPIVARFGLSLLTGLVFAVHPDGDLAMALIDKNNGFTAFANDFLGLCILLGILWAAVQRFVIRPPHSVIEIEDNVALGLLGGLVVLGFLTTGARILLTGVPADVASASFVGWPISGMLELLPVDWQRVYPWLWYAHAVFGAAFVAYLPFGKLKHIFNVPLTYFMESVTGVTKEQRV